MHKLKLTSNCQPEARALSNDSVECALPPRQAIGTDLFAMEDDGDQYWLELLGSDRVEENTSVDQTIRSTDDMFGTDWMNVVESLKLPIDVSDWSLQGSSNAVVEESTRKEDQYCPPNIEVWVSTSPSNMEVQRPYEFATILSDDSEREINGEDAQSQIAQDCSHEKFCEAFELPKPAKLSTEEVITDMMNVAKIEQLDISPPQSAIVTEVSQQLCNVALAAVSQISGVTDAVSQNASVKQITGYIRESLLCALDRAHYISQCPMPLLTPDDPETQHLHRVSSCNDWNEILKLKCRYSSINWQNRQLLEHTRDSVDDLTPPPQSLSLSLPQHDNDNDQHSVRPTTESHSTRYLASANISRHAMPCLDLSLAQLHTHSSSSSSNSCLQYGDDRAGEAQGRDALECHESLAVEAVSGEGRVLQAVDASSVKGERSIFQQLVKDAQLGDEDAQYCLSKWFVAPQFVESDKCYVCSKIFDVTCFRHSCRRCGNSLCNDHSLQRRAILKYSMTVPVRVCDACAAAVDYEQHRDWLLWRQGRVHAYLQNRLLLYGHLQVDRGVDKAFRIVNCAINVVRSTVSLNFPAKFIIETVDILKRYGMSGLAGVLMRQDFVEAVETLKRISGLDKVFSMTLHELTACIYYKLALERGLRGCAPEEEHEMHKPTAPAAMNITTDVSASSLSSASINHSCRPASDQDLDNAIRLAPLALQAVYQDSPVECQRLARTQGWSLLYHQTSSAAEQPAYAVFATDLSLLHREDSEDMYQRSDWGRTAFLESQRHTGRRREVVLAVRGTHSVQDVVTDIRAAPQEFPPSHEDIMTALTGRPPAAVRCAAGKCSVDEDCERVEGREVQEENEPEPQWEWLQVTADMTYACGGMARAALWLLAQVGPSLLYLQAAGYSVVVVGHSLGGSVAAMLTYMMKVAQANSQLPVVRCITYGSPACVDIKIAESLSEDVLSVVLHDDIISRITPQSIRLLMSELMVFRSDVFRHLNQDWSDVKERASSLWSPRWRQTQNSFSKASQMQTPAASEVKDEAIDNDPISPPAGRERFMHHHKHQHDHRNSHSDSIDESAPAESSCFAEMRDSEHSTDDRDRVNSDDDDEDAESKVMVDEEKMPELWLPGRIVHVYSHRGQYKAAEVSRDFPSLRRIQVQGNIFADHRSKSIFDALLEVRAVRCAVAQPPAWVPYDAAAFCQCCLNRFTWHSTFRGEAQEYRERFNCRFCGHLVCGPCSTKRRTVLKYGLLLPGRLCDACFYKGDYAHM